jgi:hypothetical protein
MTVYIGISLQEKMTCILFFIYNPKPFTMNSLKKTYIDSLEQNLFRKTQNTLDRKIVSEMIENINLSLVWAVHDELYLNPVKHEKIPKITN